MLTVPLAEEALVIEGTAGLMVSVSVVVPVPPALVALSEMVEVPVAVGVPEIKPLVVLTVSPEGSPVALKLVGELEAVI